MSNKNIKNYLHLYLGCQCEHNTNSHPESYMEGNKVIRKVSILDCTIMEDVKWFKPKPILRRLKDMTESEQIMICSVLLVNGWEGSELLKMTEDDIAMRIKKLNYENSFDYKTMYVSLKKFEPRIFLYLIKNGFDLFGLIDDGLAIDAANLNLKK